METLHHRSAAISKLRLDLTTCAEAMGLVGFLQTCETANGAVVSVGCILLEFKLWLVFELQPSLGLIDTHFKSHRIESPFLTPFFIPQPFTDICNPLQAEPCAFSYLEFYL